MTEPYLTSTLRRLEQPEPFVPPEVDLRGLRTMPLDCDALLASDLMALATPEEGWAALKLWCRTWQNSGRLTDDDRVLAGYACAGDRKQWAKIKAVAMRGFVLCNDSYWYHETISPLALSAWEARCKYRTKRDDHASRMEKWRATKHAQSASQNSISDTPVTCHNTRTEQECDAFGAHVVTSKRGIGRGRGRVTTKEQEQEQRAQEIQETKYELKPETRATVAMIEAGMTPTRCNPHDPRLAAAIAEGVTPELLASLVPSIPPNAAQPMAWVVAAALGQLRDARARTKPHQATAPPASRLPSIEEHKAAAKPFPAWLLSDDANQGETENASD